MLSILIPTYNDDCLELVKNLQVQAVGCLKDDFEIIVADDGSSDESVKERNKEINNIQNCRIIFRERNEGRACIRNFLVKESKGDFLLFIDGDMQIRRDDFISNYLATVKLGAVVYGGYEITENNKLKGNLRYKYEKKCENMHTFEKRMQKPYKDFHTSNFLAPRSVVEENPFDERFKWYGYEDVFFGKLLKEKGIKILHADNPVSFEKFEENEDFLRKTDESIKTLTELGEMLSGYSTLLETMKKTERMKCRNILHLFYILFNKTLKNNLLGNNPRIFMFNIYKILKINEIY